MKKVAQHIYKQMWCDVLVDTIPDSTESIISDILFVLYACMSYVILCLASFFTGTARCFFVFSIILLVWFSSVCAWSLHPKP